MSRTETQEQTSEPKPPTAGAIEKALRVLTTRYRVTLELLPKPTVPDIAPRETKEIVL